MLPVLFLHDLHKRQQAAGYSHVWQVMAEFTVSFLSLGRRENGLALSLYFFFIKPLIWKKKIKRIYSSQGLKHFTNMAEARQWAKATKRIDVASTDFA